VVREDLVLGNNALLGVLKKGFVGGVLFENIVVRIGMILLDEFGDESQRMRPSTDDEQRVVRSEGGRFWVSGGCLLDRQMRFVF